MQVSSFELISGNESSVGKKLAELSNHARPILLSVVPHKAGEADAQVFVIVERPTNVEEEPTVYEGRRVRTVQFSMAP